VLYENKRWISGYAEEPRKAEKAKFSQALLTSDILELKKEHSIDYGWFQTSSNPETTALQTILKN